MKIYDMINTLENALKYGDDFLSEKLKDAIRDALDYIYETNDSEISEESGSNIVLPHRKRMDEIVKELFDDEEYDDDDGYIDTHEEKIVQEDYFEEEEM